MESIHRVCPTEVLIDLSEDTSSSHMDFKKVNTVSAYYKSEMYLNNKGNDLFDCPAEFLADVLSASNLCLNQHFASDNTMDTCMQGNLNECKNEVQDCPTALLVDIPSTSNLCPKKPFETDNAGLEYREEKLNGCKNGIRDSNNIIYKKVDETICSKKVVAGCSLQLNDANVELETQRLRLRTPSPKSMSRISKEASKVIHNLNSSEIFDEDSLLTEEIFPIPINFECLELEDSAEQESIPDIENSYKNEILNSSVSVQTENVVIVKEKEIEVDNQTDVFSPEIFTACKKLQDTPNELSSETVSSEGFSKPDSNSAELFSLKTCGDSLSSSEFSINDGMDDVFTEKQFSSEDKENIPRRKHKFLSDDIKNKSDSPRKVLLKSKTKSDFRGTLKNLSNITHEVKNSTKCSSPNTNKNLITPCKKTSITKAKFIHPSTIKDQSGKELVSSMKKPCFSAKSQSSNSDSSCKSSSSDLKQSTVFTKMKTPSKRYSMSTPLKSMSAVKPPVTPLRSFQNPPIIKHTPQSAGNSRLSFSKSWQQPTSGFHLSNTKSMKPPSNSSIPGFTSVTNSTSKINTGKINSLSQRRQSLSQSMTAVSLRSLGKETLPLSNKNKFCSKLNLPSPFPVGQDKKIARVLFPSVRKN